MSFISTLTRTYENTWPQSPDSATISLRGAASEIQDGALAVRPVLTSGGASFGAEVFGVDWSRPIPEDIVKQLINLQDKYAVLIFRSTGLDNARHIAFTKQLGARLEVNPFFYGGIKLTVPYWLNEDSEKTLESSLSNEKLIYFAHQIENDRVREPLLWDVGNINLDGTLVQPDQRRWQHSLGNALWHTDSSYHQQRSKYSLLLSHGTPVKGGSWTHFADTRQAYADLPQSKKDKLEGLIIEHDLWHSRKLASPEAYSNPLPHELASKPPAYHRLVQTAPDGRKTLYLAAHAKLVLGYSLEESQKLIWELIDHCTQPKYVFSMEWLNGGDMVWWDNRQSMHRANPYTTSMTARDVRRTTVIDDGPWAYGVSEQERQVVGPAPSS